ncbi:hypothetical protein [Denitrobaculum tricleocarpae]|uniref:Secreted protein n=1 Tax=Denitrobaculum tricleocarpae TaxID=2591009 RepID=A0A545TL75_9PROT|nr:hypothetical protein [Denitrobaculum tricleocarpae]TQV77957.1 hypothetical protein FKG95_20715 [Denitrobaculum tricleocarpae]
MHRRIGAGVIVAVSLSMMVPALLPAQTIAEPDNPAGAPGSIDCTEVSVDYLEDPTLTHEERIALMDRALLKSLSQFDACQTAQGGSSGNSGGSGSGSGSGSGGGATGEGSGTGGGQKSLAADDLTGTEKPADAAAAAEPLQSANAPSPDSASQSAEGEPVSRQNESLQSLDNGRIPEDIPPADNDSILEAQIRQAAINEKDPEIKKRLWNEYRKYKGLPRVM